MAVEPSRGEIWPAYLAPHQPYEQGDVRPVLIVSTNPFNYGPAAMIIVLPLTRTNQNIPLHVAIEPPEGGVTEPSYILCDSVQSIAKERLGKQPWGSVSRETLEAVDDRLRILLEL